MDKQSDVQEINSAKLDRLLLKLSPQGMVALYIFMNFDVRTGGARNIQFNTNAVAGESGGAKNASFWADKAGYHTKPMYINTLSPFFSDQIEVSLSMKYPHNFPQATLDELKNVGFDVVETSNRIGREFPSSKNSGDSEFDLIKATISREKMYEYFSGRKTGDIARYIESFGEKKTREHVELIDYDYPITETKKFNSNTDSYREAKDYIKGVADTLIQDMQQRYLALDKGNDDCSAAMYDAIHYTVFPQYLKDSGLDLNSRDTLELYKAMQNVGKQLARGIGMKISELHKAASITAVTSLNAEGVNDILNPPNREIDVGTTAAGGRILGGAEIAL